jgi:ribosomal protein L18
MLPEITPSEVLDALDAYRRTLASVPKKWPQAEKEYAAMVAALIASRAVAKRAQS